MSAGTERASLEFAGKRPAAKSKKARPDLVREVIGKISRRDGLFLGSFKRFAAASRSGRKPPALQQRQGKGLSRSGKESQIFNPGRTRGRLRRLLGLRCHAEVASVSAAVGCSHSPLTIRVDAETGGVFERSRVSQPLGAVALHGFAQPPKLKLGDLVASYRSWPASAQLSVQLLKAAGLSCAGNIDLDRSRAAAG